MDTSYYTGVTAYFKQNIKNGARLRVLAEVIPALKAYADTLQVFPLNFAALQASDKFAELREFAYLFEQSGQRFPIDTPDAYQRASVSHDVYKSDILMLLHVPLVDPSAHHIKYTVEHLLWPLLEALFGNDLVCLKSRATDESGYFAEATDRIIVSADH